MTDINEHLLRLSRLGRVEIRREQINLSAMAEEVIATLRGASPKRVAEIFIQPEMEVLADQALMRVVLENLFSNAWKYSSKQPQTFIHFSKRSLFNKSVAYCVQDNGIGFDPKRAESLFEPLRANPADPLAGAGVGLATVQRIIARHGGTVWAESKPGSGASFCFTLVESAENLHFDKSL